MRTPLASERLCGGLRCHSCCQKPAWSPLLGGHCGSSSSRQMCPRGRDRFHSPPPRPAGRVHSLHFIERLFVGNIRNITAYLCWDLCSYISNIHSVTLKMRISVSEESCLRACFQGMENSVLSWFVHWTPGYLLLLTFSRSHGMRSGLQWDISVKKGDLVVFPIFIIKIL